MVCTAQLLQVGDKDIHPFGIGLERFLLLLWQCGNDGCRRAAEAQVSLPDIVWHCRLAKNFR
jgi:hypothetical protein